MPARPSEIRAFLLRYAKKKGLLVREHISDLPNEKHTGKSAFYCHVQDKEGLSTATAISYEGPDNALCMAFLQWHNPELDFLADPL